MANPSEYTYEAIDRPYDNNLDRTSEVFAEAIQTGAQQSEGMGSISSPTQVSPNALGGQSFRDMWIETWMKSINYKPKVQGFLIDGLKGYIECMRLYVGEGGIEGGSLHIPDQTTANSWHVDNAGLMWSGANVANKATAPVRLGPDGEMTLGDPTGTHLQLSGPNVRIRSSNYVAGFAGAGFTLDADLLEVGNIAARGIIRTAVFQKDVISAVGGSVMILDADVLDTDMTAADNSTVTIEGNTTFANSDVLRIKDGTDDEWMTITNAAGAPTYVVDRDEAGDYASGSNPAWKKGATVVNYGASGEGGLYMTASETNAPFMSIFDHAGSPWSTLNTRVRIGNINGYLGYVADIYGIGIGSSSAGEANLTFDSTNGIRLRSGTTSLVSFDNSGNALIAGWNIVSGYLYNLQSGTPTSSPSDGVVLASGNEALIVYEDTAKRVEVGYLSAGVYGIKGYDSGGSNVMFELSDTQMVLAGWTIVNGYLYGLTSGTPTSSPTDGIVLKSGANAVMTVYEDAAKRVEVGYLSAGVYGMKGYDSGGSNVMFELSDTQMFIAGWTISATTLANSTNIILDASNKAISINDATFGNQGVQIQYNAGTPRAYIGDGGDNFFQFDGTETSFSSSGKLLAKQSTLVAGVDLVADQLVYLSPGGYTAHISQLNEDTTLSLNFDSDHGFIGQSFKFPRNMPIGDWIQVKIYVDDQGTPPNDLLLNITPDDAGNPTTGDIWDSATVAKESISGKTLVTFAITLTHAYVAGTIYWLWFTEDGSVTLDNNYYRLYYQIGLDGPAGQVMNSGLFQYPFGQLKHNRTAPWVLQYGALYFQILVLEVANRAYPCSNLFYASGEHSNQFYPYGITIDSASEGNTIDIQIGGIISGTFTINRTYFVDTNGGLTMGSFSNDGYDLIYPFAKAITTTQAIVFPNFDRKAVRQVEITLDGDDSDTTTVDMPFIPRAITGICSLATQVGSVPTTPVIHSDDKGTEFYWQAGHYEGYWRDGTTYYDIDRIIAGGDSGAGIDIEIWISDLAYNQITFKIAKATAGTPYAAAKLQFTAFE